jgi:mannonate dehydratase
MLTADHLAYLKHMGVEYLEVRLPAAGASYDNLLGIRRKVEAAGLKVFEIMLADKYNSPEFTLGLPGRDRDIALFQNFLRDLGRAGIDATTYACYTGGVYQTGTTTTRDCQTRDFRLEEAKKRPPAGEREYTDEEMWANYEYFIKRVLPVAEEAGVRLQLHPNDPPVTHQGVARIFRSREAFRRAMKTSNYSPFSGILFCVGCFAEMAGPDGKGEDVVASIREFASSGHIFQVHFRNISSPMPDFFETFPDNGYLNMPRIMKALTDSGFNGMVVPDHVPRCAQGGGDKSAEAFIFGYIRGLIQAVSI